MVVLEPREVRAMMASLMAMMYGRAGERRREEPVLWCRAVWMACWELLLSVWMIMFTVAGTEQIDLWMADISATKLSERESFQLRCWGWNSSAFMVSVRRTRAAPEGSPGKVEPSVAKIAGT